MISCIRCACGNRVREEDLIEAGLYLADSGTGSVYVKFICSRCERVAQRTLSIAEWDEGRIVFVGSADDEAPDWVDDRHQSGLITYAEIRAFEREIDDDGPAMNALRASVGHPGSGAHPLDESQGGP